MLPACATPTHCGTIHPDARAALDEAKDKPLFDISLAQWSLNRNFFSNQLDARDFAKIARDEFDIHAVEYVNRFYKDRGNDPAFIRDLRKRADDNDVTSLLIMCDGEGALGDADETARNKTVENHHKWVEAAKLLGCHSIRVNAQSSGTWDERMSRAADGLRKLTEFAEPYDINVIVENHGGLSSNGKWLAATIREVDHPNCGTLPDFGNFCMDWDRKDQPDAWYDRYQGVRELMPFAKAVSAKSNDFDSHGNETHTDYRKMMRIVLDAGYRGHVGIEYEGQTLSEFEGVRATLTLLTTVRDELAAKV